jgi:hypothetical protein
MLVSAIPASPAVAIDLAALDAVGVAAGLLLDSPVWDITPASGGGNNRVFRVGTPDGPVALKFYPQQAADPRDRQGAEVAALRFLAHYAVGQVPRVLGDSIELNAAAFTWMDGERVETVTDRDIDAALRLTAELRALVGMFGATRIAPASAATFSGNDVLHQIRARLTRIRAVSCEHPHLQMFLDGVFAPTLARIGAWSEGVYRDAGIRFDQTLSATDRTLSPSDFGFHNALRDDAGKVTFVDFEYFGWDDPAKLVSDFVLHPGSSLSVTQRKRFLLGARTIFGGGDSAYAVRLHALYPLYGLCWVLILLNEYLPERWARRAYSLGQVNRGDVLARQLSRARALLERIESSYATGPYVL